MSVCAARERARPHRRSVGRPHAGVGDLLAAAGLQLRAHPGGARPRCLLGHEAARRRHEGRGATAESTCRATPAPGFVMGRVSACASASALIWHIWWLAIGGFVGMIVALIVRLRRRRRLLRADPPRSSASKTNATCVWPVRGKRVSTIVHQQSQTLRRASARGRAGPRASPRCGGNTVFGFWIYLMSDCLLFAGLFATYAVLSRTPRAARRPRSCSTCRTSARDAVPAAQLLHLRPGA